MVPLSAPSLKDLNKDPFLWEEPPHPLCPRLPHPLRPLR